MHVYTITNFDGATIAIHGTLAEAHADAKRRPMRTELTIYLRDVPTDKSSVIDMLRAAVLGTRYEVPSENLGNLGEWVLTPRGGLEKVEQGDEANDPMDDFNYVGSPHHY